MSLFIIENLICLIWLLNLFIYVIIKILKFVIERHYYWEVYKLDTRTHKMLAYKLHDHFAKNEIWLSKLGLAFGSMKPDFVEGDISHFKDETMVEFYNQFEELKEMNPDQKPYRFSAKLGELFHYIADYFSQAHNDPKLEPGTFWEKTTHIFHEWKLNRHAQNIHPDFFQKEIEEKFIYKNDLKEFIEKEHQEFLDREYSFKDDLASTFRICVLMTKKLIYEMQLEHNYSFAHVFNLRHRLLYQNT